MRSKFTKTSSSGRPLTLRGRLLTNGRYRNARGSKTGVEEGMLLMKHCRASLMRVGFCSIGSGPVVSPGALCSLKTVLDEGLARVLNVGSKRVSFNCGRDCGSVFVCSATLNNSNCSPLLFSCGSRIFGTTCSTLGNYGYSGTYAGYLVSEGAR